MRCSRTKLADVIGKSEQTIANWLEEGMPRIAAGGRGVEGEYDTAEVIRWMIAREAGSRDEDGNVIVFEAERARLTKEQADKVAMDNALKRGDMVSLSETAQALTTMIVNTKTRLLSIPTKAAPQVVGVKSLPGVREILERFINEALHDLSTASVETLGRDAGGMEPAAEADGESVGGPAPKVKPRGKRRAGAVDH